MRRPVLAVALALFVAAALPAMERLRVQAIAHSAATERYEDVYYLPPAEWLPTLSLGYREAIADVLWLKSLLYFSDEVRHTGHSRYIYEYAKSMLTLDPYFHRVYAWLAMAGVYRAAEVDTDVMLETVRFLEQGFRLFPEDGELAWDIAATLLFEIKPHLPAGPEKDRIEARGREFQRIASRMGAGPPWAAIGDANALMRLGQLDRAIEHLEAMRAVVSDPATKAQIEAALAQYGAQAEAEGARTQGAALEADRRRDFPYLPLELYLLVGPRRLSEPGPVTYDAAPER